MKKLLIFSLIAALLLGVYEYIRPVEKVTVKATMGAGDTVWGLVSDAMQRTGDNRPVDEVIYHTTRNSNLNAADIGSLPIGTVLIIPCERGL